jgi:hypothetical protein
MPSKPAVLPLSPTTPFERAQVRFLLRLWPASVLAGLNTTIHELSKPIPAALRTICEKYRKAPTKWPVDALIVHPKIYKLMEERFSDSPVIFQLQQALLLQGLLNKRKRGELKPRPSGAAKKKAAKKGK